MMRYSDIVFVATPRPQPAVDVPIPLLVVDSGVYFEYQIPENAFLDLQDGNTRNLRLQLLDSNNQVMETA